MKRKIYYLIAYRDDRPAELQFFENLAECWDLVLNNPITYELNGDGEIRSFEIDGEIYGIDVSKSH